MAGPSKTQLAWRTTIASQCRPDRLLPWHVARLATVLLVSLAAHVCAAHHSAALAADAPAQFEAIWPDGTRQRAATIDHWTDDGRTAAIGGRRLFSGPAPVRTIRNLAIPHRSAEGPFVEFIQGDVFPGLAIGGVPVENPAGGNVLLVRPGEAVDLPGAPPRDAVRIRNDWVRRLVWTRPARQTWHPGTAFGRDGSRLAFDRLRIQPDGIRLLTDSKVVTVGWGELEELHFPKTDWWEMHAREVAALSPDSQSPLVRICGATGMRVTTSLARFRAWNRSQQPASSDALQLVQPAWCDDVLCVRRATVRQYAVSPVFEIPLSAIEPCDCDHRPVFSRILACWSRDRSAAGGPLVSGGREFAWGLGSCGEHTLDFPLPAAAMKLTTAFGLDRAAGHGGCTRGRVECVPERGATGPPDVLFETEVLTGTARDPAAIRVELPFGTSPRRLRLVADAVNGGASPADLFDIRDFCDWLEPVLELQRETWTASVSAAVAATEPSLAGWTIDGAPGRDWRPGIWFDATARPYPAFRRAWTLPGYPLTLVRKLKVPPSGQANWLMRMRRTNATAAGCRVDVLVNDREIAKLPLVEIIPEQSHAPIAINLSGFVGREVQIALRLVPLSGETQVVWEGAEFETTSKPER